MRTFIYASAAAGVALILFQLFAFEKDDSDTEDSPRDTIGAGGANLIPSV